MGKLVAELRQVPEITAEIEWAQCGSRGIKEWLKCLQSQTEGVNGRMGYQNHQCCSYREGPQPAARASAENTATIACGSREREPEWRVQPFSFSFPLRYSSASYVQTHLNAEDPVNCRKT